MRFHIQCRSYQFKALPFGLSTAPMEFTVVAKEVKREDQPDPSMRQSGPFLQSDASVIRWTSGHHL